MKQSELEKNYVKNGQGTFTPLYTCTKSEPIKDEQGNVIDYELVGYAQIKTAEECYSEWLEKFSNPPKPQPTPLEQAQSDIQKIISLSMLRSSLLEDALNDANARIAALETKGV